MSHHLPLIRRWLRVGLERLAPGLASFVRTLRHRRYFRRQFSGLHAEVRQALFPNDAPIVVQTGPFYGMRYFDEVVWGPITPKWLGTYELELHPVLARIAQQTYARVIDVGCAEGYYAVGLALLLPATRVVAFDTDFLSRRQARRLAALNQVAARVEVRSFCRPADLNALAQGTTLVVCDIEGFEMDLLDPLQAPSLLRCDLLVEVHEKNSASQEVQRVLESRFTATHQIVCLEAQERDPQLLPGLPSLNPGLLRRAMQEHRQTGRVWLWMRRNAAGASPT